MNAAASAGRSAGSQLSIHSWMSAVCALAARRTSERSSGPRRSQSQPRQKSSPTPKRPAHPVISRKDSGTRSGSRPMRTSSCICEHSRRRRSLLRSNAAGSRSRSARSIQSSRRDRRKFRGRRKPFKRSARDSMGMPSSMRSRLSPCTSTPCRPAATSMPAMASGSAPASESNVTMKTSTTRSCGSMSAARRRAARASSARPVASKAYPRAAQEPRQSA